MYFSTKILSQTVTQLCLAHEVVDVVISPGSRNAPLTIGFTGNSSFNAYSIVDERCAAFFAMGIAQQKKKPVLLVCTSGSALLNYYPAIAEAFYSDIPLVVVSADRPEHLVEVGDGQTIMQENVYGKHILFSANCKEGKLHQSFNEAQINKALHTAIEKKGPVHINVPFSEPLYNTTSILDVHPTVTKVETTLDFNTSDLDNLLNIWNTSERKMVLVGVLAPNSIEEKLIEKLANDPSVIVLKETTSNLHHPNFIGEIDQLIAPLSDQELSDLKPNLLVTFGGMVVSKKVKAFLRAYAPKKHFHLDVKKAYDTFFVLTSHIRCNPSVFLEQVSASPSPSQYRDMWLSIKVRRCKLHKKYISQLPFSDFSAFNTIFETLPIGLDLQLSNSTAIRYSQLFTLPEEVCVFCNRGTSGIDGSTSTAIGAAVASKKQTLFITGDLSFFYDSNALWNNYIPTSFRIIVLNNSGGGIFRILPNAKQTEQFETYFETKHQLTAAQLCKMFDFEYLTASSLAETQNCLQDFYSISNKPKLLEIFTPATVNDTVLLDYFKAIKLT